MGTKKNALKEKSVSDFAGKKISRKEAIKKTGFMAASAATTMILLNKNAQGSPFTSGGEVPDDVRSGDNTNGNDKGHVFP